MQDMEVIIDNDIEPKRCHAKKSWKWIGDAFMLYIRAPLQWTLLTLILALAFLLVSAIPLVGWLLSTLLMPILMGGIMRYAKLAAAGQSPQLMTAFDTFLSSPLELLKIGVFYIIGVLTIVALLSAFMFVSFELGLMPRPTPELLKERGLMSMWPFLLMFFSFLAVIYSAYFFAPTLVVLRGFTARDALRLSFLGFWRNWFPIMLMGVLGAFLLALASLPFMLGLLVALPVMLLVSYTSYLDIYEN